MASPYFQVVLGHFSFDERYYVRVVDVLGPLYFLQNVERTPNEINKIAETMIFTWLNRFESFHVSSDGVRNNPGVSVILIQIPPRGL